MSTGHISLGSIAPGRSCVYVEAYSPRPDGSWLTFVGEIFFEFEGLETALANYVARAEGVEVNHLRFSELVLGENRRTLGTWTRTEGHRVAEPA